MSAACCRRCDTSRSEALCVGMRMGLPALCEWWCVPCACSTSQPELMYAHSAVGM